jgi:hypothetical protein
MTTGRVLRSRRMLRIVLASTASACLLGGGPSGTTSPASAQTAPSLGGLQGRAAASGVYAIYAPEGLLPISPLAEVGAPDALATISSGPTTFARASVADPGDIIANPGAVIALLDPSFPGESIPAYPYRVSATSGIGEPKATSSPAPGLDASVEVTPTGSKAQASLPAAAAPAIASLGSIHTTATTSTTGATATVTARTVVNDFSLLDVVIIDSIVTELTATSDGVETTLEGGTTVTGASVMGQAVTIDSKGVHAAPAEGSPTSLLGLPDLLGGGVEDALSAAGIRLTVAGPVEQQGETSGRLASSGVRIDLELSGSTLPGFTALADALPPLESPVPGAPSVEDLLVAAQANHLQTIEVGRGVVSLTARPAVTIAPLPFPDAPALPSVPMAAAPSLVGAPVAHPSPAPSAGQAAEAPAPIATTPAGVTLASGIGALAALALIAQPFAGKALARLPDALLGTASADHCPWEEP